MIPLILLPFVASIGEAGTVVADDPATLVAEAVIDADTGPVDRRRAALRTLDRLGAHPAEGADDPRAAWRRQTGVAVEAERGRLLGPAFRHGEIAGGAVWTVEQIFLAGRPTTVSLASRPRQATALEIRGPETAVRCADPTRCRWVPRFTERYRITVTNRAPAPARFVVVTD